MATLRSVCVALLLAAVHADVIDVASGSVVGLPARTTGLTRRALLNSTVVTASPIKSPPKKSPSPKKKSPSPKKKSPSPKKKSPSPKKKSPSPKKKSPSPKKKSPSPKKKSPSPPKKKPSSPPKKSPSPKKSPPKSPKKSPPKPAPTPSGGSHNVAVGPDGLSVFAPKALNVKVGDKVTFTLKSMGHNVVFTDVPAGVDKSKLSNAMWVIEGIIDDKYTITIPKAGTYKYICSPHAGVGMVATITAS